MIRLAVVAAAGIALLPSDREQQQRLYEHAASATTWAMTFCDRNATTCATAEKGWVAFVAKAEFGARMALDLARDSEEAGPSVARSDDFDAPVRIAPAKLERSSGTLTPDDLKPSWRGKAASKGSI